MKKTPITIALLTAVVAMGTTAFAEEKQETSKQAEVKKQTTCPVMGGKINKAQYVDVKGKRIYVCCAGCIGKIKADPDKYIKQMEAEGITLEKAPGKKEAKTEGEEHTDHSEHHHE